MLKLAQGNLNLVKKKNPPDLKAYIIVSIDGRSETITKTKQFFQRF